MSGLHYSCMATARNHPEGVTLDLLIDTVARLDTLLNELERPPEHRRIALKADPREVHRDITHRLDELDDAIGRMLESLEDHQRTLRILDSDRGESNH